MAAKYYIYRNLHTGGFSVRYRGKVIDRISQAEACEVEFKINPAGRAVALATNQRNVHAFVVCTKYQSTNNEIDVDTLQKVSYNPFIAEHFTVNSIPVTKANCILLFNGSCYLGD